MKVTRQQLEQVHEAFLDGFDYTELEQLLYFRLSRELDKIVSDRTNFSVVCFKLLREAEKGGWLEKLILAAIQKNPENEKIKLLALELRLETESNDSTGEQVVVEDRQDRQDPDTSDPLLVIEDFRKDLEKIPTDQSWSSEDYEQDLESLRSWLAKLPTQVRGLIPKRMNDLEQSVLCELRFEDAIEDVLTMINSFEICLNCLLDPSRRQSVPDQTRYVQSFRSKSRSISEGLSRLQHLGRTSSKAPSKEGVSSENIDLSLATFIRDLRSLHVDARRLDERRRMLAADFGVGATLNAVIEYLRGSAVPAENNTQMIRELLLNTSGFIEHTALVQKRLPSVSEATPLFSPGEGARLQKICDEALDSLDLYCRINRELISNWEEAVLYGAAGRADPEDLYRARRSLIEKLIIFRRRIAALAR